MAARRKIKKTIFEGRIYEEIDIPFYREEILPILPKQILDFHVHIWKVEHWKEVPWEKDRPGSKYMVLEGDNSVEELLADGKKIFPAVDYNAVCFGFPSPSTDVEMANKYVSEVCEGHKNLFPLMLIGRNTTPPEEIMSMLQKKGFLGYKVLTPWYGDDYGTITVKDMIGPIEMEIANKFKLIVLLHVPGAGRLADPKVQEDIEEYATQFPNANLVLAHCGRCYMPEQIIRAINFLKKLNNVYLDTAMVMEPQVLQIIFENIGYKRVIFGTDLPIARMRGRRVYVMNHWVDIVVGEYPESAYRVPAKNISATFMAWEIILAIKRAAYAVGLSPQQLYEIFYENGMRLLECARAGRQREKTSEDEKI